MLGVAVILQDGEYSYITDDEVHGLCVRTVASGEPFRYKFGSCWSKGKIKSAADWFDLVEAQ